MLLWCEAARNLNATYQIPLIRSPLESLYVGGLSAHNYNTLLTGELLVAVGGRASSPLWGRDWAARVLKWSNGLV